MSPRGEGQVARGMWITDGHIANILVGGDGCWEWPGKIASNGYGRHGKRWAHRLVYELIHNKIPDGLELDHLCRNTKCVRPSHLDAVTHRENTARGNTTLRQSIENVCRRGHRNAFVPNGPTARVCSVCRRNAKRRSAANARVREFADCPAEGAGALGTCHWCAAILIRRPGESDRHFAQRRFCDRSCSAAGWRNGSLALGLSA